MKTHIRKEKKTAPLKLGDGMLLHDKDGKMYKVCDTVEYDETHTDDEVIKVALYEDNLVELFLIHRLCLQIEVKCYDYGYSTQRGSKEKEICCEILMSVWMYLLGR